MSLMASSSQAPASVTSSVTPAVTTPASTLPEIVVGPHTLLPNKAGQKIPFYVTGGQAVYGMDLNVQIADGGTVAGGKINGPKITAVDILTGTIFAKDNTGQGGVGKIYPQVWGVSTTTNTGTVKANGLIGTITVDTTGFTAGHVYQLLLAGTINGDSDFAILNATIVNGTISIQAAPPKYGSISGDVFSDKNGDGRQEKGEAGLTGWTVNLFSGGKKIASEMTDKNGNYEFDHLAAGKYDVYVVQQQPTKYKATGKSLTGYHVTLHAGKAATGNTFGEKQIA